VNHICDIYSIYPPVYFNINEYLAITNIRVLYLLSYYILPQKPYLHLPHIFISLTIHYFITQSGSQIRRLPLPILGIAPNLLSHSCSYSLFSPYSKKTNVINIFVNLFALYTSSKIRIRKVPKTAKCTPSRS
jgi:hypothetical protein